MKKTFTLATLIFIAFTVNGQHATYSRSNVVKKHVDILQLVSNVSNTNHLLVITPQSKVVINILNSLLEQVSKIETPIKISEEATINIITNKDEYFLFTNVPNTRKNGLWRINAKGDIEDLIVPYTKMLDFLFSESNGTLRMVTDNHQIFFLSHFHYPRLRKIVTTQVRVDNKMKVLESRKVAYDFKPSAEKLHEIKLLDANNLLVLKTGVDTNSNRRLQLVKVNFATGVGEIATYNTGSLILFNPHLHTTPADSTIIIYATIGALRSRQNLFFGKVNKSFTNVEAPSILQKDIPNNYVLVKDGNQKWLFFTATLTGGRLIYNDQSNYSSKNFADRIIESNTWWNSYSSSGEYSTLNSTSSNSDYLHTFYNNFSSKASNRPHNATNTNINPIKLWVVDPAFNPVADSIANNKKEKHNILIGEHANFMLNNKNYLLFKQLFNNAKGLVVFYAGDKEILQSSNILVNSKYEYILAQTQVVGQDSVLIPFLYRNEAGLLKITLFANPRQ